MGFHSLDSDEQTENELDLMIWFLTLWLDLLPVTDGIIWDDPDDDAED